MSSIVCVIWFIFGMTFIIPLPRVTEERNFAKSFEDLAHCHSSSKCSQGGRDSSCDSKKPDESYCHTKQRADLVPMGLDVGATVLVYGSFTGVIVKRASDNSPNFFVEYRDESGKTELEKLFFTALEVIADSVS